MDSPDCTTLKIFGEDEISCDFTFKAAFVSLIIRFNYFTFDSLEEIFKYMI